MDDKPTLLADLGATNARFAITLDGLSYQDTRELKISDYGSVESHCKAFLTPLNYNNISQK